jgi:hypothetical protein
LRGNVPAITATILYGREIGLPPMQSLRSVHMIKGRPALAAEAMRGLALAAGHEIEYVKADGGTCTVRGRRRGSLAWHSVTWTMDNAQQLGLTRNPVWRSYPRRMLVARATSELCRDVFADVIGGFVAVEDMDVLPDGAALESVEVVDAPPPPTRTVGRGRRSAPASVAPGTGGEARGEDPRDDAGSRSGDPTEIAPKLRGAARADRDDDGGGPASLVPPPPSSREDEVRTVTPTRVETLADRDDHHLRESDEWEETPLPIEGDVQDRPPPPDPETRPDPGRDSRSPDTYNPPTPPESVETGEAASRDQGRAVFALLGKLGYADVPRVERLQVASALVGREVASFNDLTRREASTLIDTLAILAESSDGGDQLAAIVGRS